MRILLLLLSVLLTGSLYASQLPFRAAYVITNVVTNASGDDGPYDLKLSGTILDRSPQSFKATNVALNDLIFYWNTNYGVATTYRITNIISCTTSELVCDASGYIVGTNWFDYGAAPEVGTFSIITHPSADLVAPLPSLYYTDISEYLQNAARNITMSKAITLGGAGWSEHVATNAINVSNYSLINVRGIELNSSLQTNWGITNAVMIESTNNAVSISNYMLYVTISTNYTTNEITLSHMHLTGIQGGTNRQYYHLSTTQLADVVWALSNATELLDSMRYTLNILEPFYTQQLVNATSTLNNIYTNALTNIFLVTSDTNKVTKSAHIGTVTIDTNYSKNGVGGYIVDSYTWTNKQTFPYVTLNESNIPITVKATPISVTTGWQKVCDYPVDMFKGSFATIGNSIYLFNNNSTNFWKCTFGTETNVFTPMPECPLDHFLDANFYVTSENDGIYLHNSLDIATIVKFDGTNWTTMTAPQDYMQQDNIANSYACFLRSGGCLFSFGGKNSASAYTIQPSAVRLWTTENIVRDASNVPMYIITNFVHQYSTDYDNDYSRDWYGEKQWYNRRHNVWYLDSATHSEPTISLYDYVMHFIFNTEYYYGYTYGYLKLTDMPAARFSVTAVKWPGAHDYEDEIYVIGGRDSTQYSKSEVYMYRPSYHTYPGGGVNVWTTSVSMPVDLSDAGAVMYNGKLWVIGGVSGYAGGYSQFGCYSFDKATWTTESSLPVSAYGNSCAVSFGEYIYVATFDGGIYRYGPSIPSATTLQHWYKNATTLVSQIHSYSNVFSNIIGDGTYITNITDSNTINAVMLTNSNTNAASLNGRTLNLNLETNTFTVADINNQAITRLISFKGPAFNVLYAATDLDSRYKFRVYISEDPTFDSTITNTSDTIDNWFYWNGIMMRPFLTNSVCCRYLNDYSANVTYAWPNAVRGKKYYVKGDIIDVTAAETVGTINLILDSK